MLKSEESEKENTLPLTTAQETKESTVPFAKSCILGSSVCNCVSVHPHIILAVRAITNKTKDTIMLSVGFEAIAKRCFS